MSEDSTDIELLRGEGRKPAWPARPALEVALCVIGSLLSAFIGPLGTALMVVGVYLLGRPEENKAWLGALGCVIPCAILSIVSWVNLGSLALPPVICAVVMGLFLPGHIGISTVCACIVGTCAMTMGIDAALLAAWGSNLLDYVMSVFDEMGQQMSLVAGQSGGVVLSAAMEQSIELMRTIWPLIYLGQAAVTVIAGLVALAIARRESPRCLYEAFVRYDMPLWGMVLIVACAACWAAAQYLPSWSAALMSAATCLFMCLRVLYFLQGLAVAMSLMDAHGFGPVARILIIVLLLMLESALYVVCVIGAVDVFANFRRLPRHTKVVQATAIGDGESKQ